MAYWLFKSEAETWSWDQQLGKAELGEEWSGVRNYQARNFMREMKTGDKAFFYHSGKDREIVGIVEIITEIHADSSTDDARWQCVDVKAVRTFTKPVTLAECKADTRLREMILVSNPRLSVQPVSSQEWATICELGKTKPD